MQSSSPCETLNQWFFEGISCARNLTNRVVALIDDERNTQAAVETLERAGVADRELAT